MVKVEELRRKAGYKHGGTRLLFQLREEEAGMLRVYTGRLTVKKKRNSSIRLAWLPVVAGAPSAPSVNRR